MAKITPRVKFDLMKLCTPATIYFVISLIALILVGVGNLGETNELCIGEYKCNVGDNTLVFVLNAIYILFWTFILDLMCKTGYGALSWLVLLLPFIIIGVVLAMVMVKKEGFRTKLNVDTPYNNIDMGKQFKLK